MKLTRNHLIFLAVTCVTLLGVIVWVLYAEYDRPWKNYQAEFRKMEYDLVAGEYQSLLLAKEDGAVDSEGMGEREEFLKNQLTAISKRREKIEQLWFQDIGETDRCVTCHQGADRQEFRNAPQPYKTHSGNYLELHPVEKFGCVICHEGQGPALTVSDAHGYVANWTRPLLKGAFAQSSCGKCHYMDRSLPLDAELPGASKLMEGRRLFQEFNCSGCHELKGYERPDRIAPALTSVGMKVNRDWLVKWLKNPKDYLPNTKMPQFNFTDEEIEYISDYLINLQLPAIRRGMARQAPTGASDINDGKALIESLGCLGCHRIENKGNDFAPAFSGIGNKVNYEWLFQFLKNPKSYDPDTIIPDFAIAEKDIPGMAAFLMSLTKYPPSPEGKDIQSGYDLPGEGGFLTENMEKGGKLVKDYGCAGCHKIEKLSFRYNAPALDRIGDKRTDELLFNNVNATEKTLINWLKLKVKDPGKFVTDKIVARMPDYGFSDTQSKALAVFLLSMKKASVPVRYVKNIFDEDSPVTHGKKVIEKYNCLGCHKINKQGGDIGPDLSNEAKKSRPEWLFAFLKRPHKIRPVYILNAKMPDFNFSDEESYAVIEYLSSISEEPHPYFAEPAKEIHRDDIRNGEKLYQEIFACSACHTVNGRGGEVGPDHTDMASRLKREWVEQWLQNPQTIKPDVRMPRYQFKGWEFEALTDYLMTLGQYRFVKVKSAD